MILAFEQQESGLLKTSHARIIPGRSVVGIYPLCLVLSHLASAGVTSAMNRLSPHLHATRIRTPSHRVLRTQAEREEMPLVCTMLSVQNLVRPFTPQKEPPR